MSVLNRIPTSVWLTLLTLVGVYLLFDDLLLSPNSFFLSYGGDGFTPYYVSPFYAKYGSGSWHEMFQYPFGNHLLYVSSPLIAWISWGMEQVGLGTYTTGLINLSVILSFFPAVWLMYQILRKSLIPVPLSILFSLVIIFHSPQIMRISGYFGLAYVCFVPLLWYLLLRGKSHPFELRSMMWYGLSVLLFALVHPYYALIGAAFLLSWIIIHFLQNRSRLSIMWKWYLMACVIAVLPGLLIKFWEWVSWQGPSDFVAYPYGYLKYIAGFESIFLPMHEPFLGVWKTFIGVKPRNWEGYAYVGLVGLIVLIGLIWRIGLHIRKKKSIRILKPVLPDSLRTAVWAGALLLIPAMSHVIQAWPGFLEYLGPLRHFRSIGRLTWPFYFVFMTVSVWYLYAWYRLLLQKQLLLLARALIAVSVFSWSLNILVQARSQQREFLSNHVERFWEREIDFSERLVQKGYQTEDFQAILALPFYHFGSQKLNKEYWPSTRMSMALSLSTGLPMINNRSARAPISATLASMQLISHPLVERNLLPSQLPNQKPLLLMTVPGLLAEGEQWLIDQAQWIDSLNGVQLYHLPFEKIKGEGKTHMAEYYANKSRFHPVRTPYGKFYMSHRTQAVYFHSNTDNPVQLAASGQPSPSDTVTLYEGKIRAEYPRTTMEFSCWVRQEQASNYQGYVYLVVSKDNKEVKRFKRPLYHAKDIMGEWVRMDISFLLPNAKHHIRVYSDNPNLTVDNVLIRPEKVDIYIQGDTIGELVMNNFIL